MKLKTIIAAIAVLTVSISISQAAAYLKFDGVDGESAHPDGGGDGWIIIESMSAPILKVVGGSATAGDITCLKELDKSSPKLMEALCTGSPISTMTVSLTKMTPAGEKEYYRMTMKNIALKGNEVSVIRELDKSSTKAMENVTLGYTEVEWTYIVLDKDGKATETIKRNFTFGAE